MQNVRIAKKLIARQKKYKQRNNNNSFSSPCEVKWYNYLVVIEMTPLKKSPQTT